MRNIIQKINMVLIYSDQLLTKPEVFEDEIYNYKKEASSIYVELINMNISDIISEIAMRGLRFKIRKIQNPILRWMYYQLTSSRDHITYNAPYLKRYSESDYNKQYIFWTRHKFMGLKHNIEMSMTEPR